MLHVCLTIQYIPFLFLLLFHRYAEYEKKRNVCSNSTQPAISQFLQSSPQKVYSANHPRQKAITNAILTDLVIGWSMPLSLTENGYFWHSLSVADSRYQPVPRRTITLMTIWMMQSCGKTYPEVNGRLWTRCPTEEALNVSNALPICCT